MSRTGTAQVSNTSTTLRPVMPLENVKALIFDLDDTITDFRTASDEAFEEAFKAISTEHGVDITRMRDVYMELFEDYYTMHLKGHINLDEFRVYRFSRMFELLGLPADDRFLDMCVDFQTKYSERLRTFPQACEVLRELDPVYPLGLITNGPTEAQWQKISKFALDRLFEVILVSGMVGIAKPDPLIFQVAFKGLRSEPGTTVMVGNSLEHDYQGAINSGCRFIWANHLREPLPEGWPEPEAIIHHFDELRGLLL